MSARNYQLEQIDQCAEKLAHHRKVLVQLPTGGGKTYEFALVAQRWFRNNDTSVLIVVDRIELLHQARKTIKDICGFDAVLITRDTKYYQIGRVYIAMVESLLKRTHLMADIGLVIIDECHVANFNKLHAVYLEEYIIGYTATPIASSKKEPLNKYYNDIVVGPQIRELIEQGFLAQNLTRCPKTVVEKVGFSIDKMTGDYNERQMFDEYKKPHNVVNTVTQYAKFCKGTKTLIYNVNVAHSKLVNETFCMVGLNSRHLDAESATPQEREDILKWFKETPDAILNNVGILTRGFDEPTIINIIINFSTISVPKWLQCCGRGGRIIDYAFIEKYQHLYPYDLDIKYSFNIIDLGGNAISGLGDWNDDRDWANIFYYPEKPTSGGVAPTKICPNCDGLVHAAVRKCPLRTVDGELCEYEFKKKTVAEEIEEEMIVITRNVDVQSLISRNENKYPYYTFLKMGEEVVDKLFEEFKNPSETLLQRAFLAYYELCIDWYKQTLANINGNIPDIRFSEWHIKRARRNFDNLVNVKQEQLQPAMTQ